MRAAKDLQIPGADIVLILALRDTAVEVVRPRMGWERRAPDLLAHFLQVRLGRVEKKAVGRRLLQLEVMKEMYV